MFTYIYIYVCEIYVIFFFCHEISMCLQPEELMQIFPLTSAGLGLAPSLTITLEMLLMETTYFAIQDPKQSRELPRLLPAKPRGFLPVREHSHPFPSHPGPAEGCAGSPFPLSWDAGVVLNSAGLSWKFQISRNVFSLPAMLPRDVSSDTQPVTGVSLWKLGQISCEDLQLFLWILDGIIALLETLL